MITFKIYTLKLHDVVTPTPEDSQFWVIIMKKVKALL